MSSRICNRGELEKDQQSLISQVQKQFCNSKLGRAVDDVIQDLVDQV